MSSRVRCPCTPAGRTDIAGGADYRVAARDDGSVIAWGADANAQLGDGTVNPTRKPVTVLPAGNAIMRVAITETGKSGFAY
ncbi:RCC1 domain-containing protein [Streptomyces sp. NPDC088141]|uniref:RCC1 domain-containing protein n=1 Tax=Streptomyces sp. NPDC088141 TaxID=3155179 RepID=UPI0034465FEA